MYMCVEDVLSFDCKHTATVLDFRPTSQIIDLYKNFVFLRDLQRLLLVVVQILLMLQVIVFPWISNVYSFLSGFHSEA